MRDTASHNRDLPAGRVRLDTGTNCRDDLTSDGHHYASAGFARRFAPDMARRVNAILAEARWDLVPSTAGSQRNVDSLRAAPGDLQKSASEQQQGLGRLRDGNRQTAHAGDLALDSAPRLLAGALLPIALSDEAFQTMHLSLPLTWVMPAFRARLFGAFDGAFWPAHRVVAGVAAGGLLLGGLLGGLMGGLLGRGRCIPTPQWRPALDME